MVNIGHYVIPPIAARRAQWVVNRRHDSCCYTNIDEIGLIRHDTRIDIILSMQFYISTTKRRSLVDIFHYDTVCVTEQGTNSHWSQ